jgi:site-specific recombinase XerD
VSDEKEFFDLTCGINGQWYLAWLNESTEGYVEQARAKNTLRAYKTDWLCFGEWCIRHNQARLPASAETVANYLSCLADEGYRTATIKRRMAAISQGHQLMEQLSPVKSSLVRLTWQGIKRAKGVAPVGKTPALVSDVRRMVATLPDNVLGMRDRALLLLGFAGAFRRSELVGLNVEDVAEVEEGLQVWVRRSKTDQEGEGELKGIPYGGHLETCPVRSYRAWLQVSGITEGAIFRGVNRHGQLLPCRLTDRSVARVVKRSAEAAGLNPTNYAGHSLRSGLATSAAAAGKSERSIMKQTGHRSIAMVRRYIREGTLFRDNAAANIGL